MNSIFTNQSAVTALQNLNQKNGDLNITRSRISTGLKVQSAPDNGAYWSIAATMRSDNMALSTVKDALNLGSSTIDGAAVGMEAAKDVVNEIKAKLVAATEPGLDRTKVQDEITALQGQLQSIANSAVFADQNWLVVGSSDAGHNGTKSVVASFTRDTAGEINIETIDIDITGTELYDANDQSGIIDQACTSGGSTIAISAIDISALTDSAADLTMLNEHIAIVDAGLDDVISGASDLGAAKNHVSLQQSFVENLSDAISAGVGALVDADMNQESTRLQALQVQQQLGVQSLSIANQNSQLIL